MAGKKKRIAMKAEVKSKSDLELALNRIDEIDEAMKPLVDERNTLKAAATKYAAAKDVTVTQLDGVYYRLIRRTSTHWDNKELKKICGKQKVKHGGKMKSLWQMITRRVIDNKALDDAVARGWLSTDEVEKALVEVDQAPFLQRFAGEAD